MMNLSSLRTAPSIVERRQLVDALLAVCDVAGLNDPYIRDLAAKADGLIARCLVYPLFSETAMDLQRRVEEAKNALMLCEPRSAESYETTVSLLLLQALHALVVDDSVQAGKVRALLEQALNHVGARQAATRLGR